MIFRIVSCYFSLSRRLLPGLDKGEGIRKMVGPVTGGAYKIEELEVAGSGAKSLENRRKIWYTDIKRRSYSFYLFYLFSRLSCSVCTHRTGGTQQSFSVAAECSFALQPFCCG
jgi:hypothetical protein